MNFLKKMLAVGVIITLMTSMGFSIEAEYRFEKCDLSISLKNHANIELDGQLNGEANISNDGKIGNALPLIGDGIMSVKHSSSLDIVDNLSIAFWIKLSKIKEQTLITKGRGFGTDRRYSSDAEYFIKMEDSGRLVYRHNLTIDSSVVAYSDVNLSIGEWTHVILVRDNNLKNIRFYINAIGSSEYNYINNPQSSYSENLLIGKCASCVTPDKSYTKFDEIKIYNTALSIGEVNELYNHEKGGKYITTDDCDIAPLAFDDEDKLPFVGGSIDINILANDRSNNRESCSVDGSTVIITSTFADANLSKDSRTLVVPSEGTWSVNESAGFISFVSNSSFSGNPRSITYAVLDSCNNLSNEAEISLTRVPKIEVITTPEITLSLGDMVWYDTDQNGIQGDTEEGVENVKVTLFDNRGNRLNTTVTNSKGKYQFTNISKGSYVIEFSSLPADYIFTSQNIGDNDQKDSDVDSSGRTVEFSVSNILNDLKYDAGIVKKVVIHPSPIAVNDSGTISTLGIVNLDILSNDRVNDSTTCFINASTVIFSSTLNDDNKTSVVNGEGNWSVENNGSISFVSDKNFLKDPTDIKYRVFDSCGNLSNEAIVSLTRVVSNIDDAQADGCCLNVGDINCKCKNYKSSVPSINGLGLAIIFLITSLLASFFIREEKLSV